MTVPKGNRKNIAYVPLVDSLPEGQKNWKWPSIVLSFWVLSFVLGGLLYFVDMFELQAFFSIKKIASDFSKAPQLPQIYHELNGYLINTPGCRIPDMDPLDPSVKEFVFKPPELKCKKYNAPLFESNLTTLYLVESRLKSYNNVANFENLSCCYQEFWRKTPVGNQPDKMVEYSNACTPIVEKTVAITHEEYVRVVCNTTTSNETVYQDYFSFIPLKKTPQVKQDKEVKSKPNVLVVGLDAVSRVNLRRQLPMTHNYLTEELGAIELFGYNKVADNTFVNLMPVLTGMFEEELRQSCWPKSNPRFDKCTFLWNNYSRNDYLTAFGEDCGWIGIFNYNKKGFVNQSVDYYYTSFSYEAEGKIGKENDFNCNQCMGGRETYRTTLDYIGKFAERMAVETVPYFGFFWSSTLSHDYLNRPNLGDLAYYEFFHNLKKLGHLENTILIFMSDHGIRWGGIRQTYQGQLEERLPFVLTVLPQWIKTKYPEAVMNFNKNKRRLTTPFDLHETLKDLLNVDNLRKARKIMAGEPVQRAYSLFNEIPINRSCQDAQIASHWCTCQQSVSVNLTDVEVVTAAQYAVSHMNEQLDGYAQCATLTLDSILSARVLTYDTEHITDKKSIKDYTITIKTMPGEGVFEVTVRSKYLQQKGAKKDRQEKDLWKHLSVTGTVSRLNLYGKQSYCITDFHLKLYCYCKSLLEN